MASSARRKGPSRVRSSFDRPKTEASAARSDAQRREGRASAARSDATRREGRARAARSDAKRSEGRTWRALLGGLLLVAAPLTTLANGAAEPSVDTLLGSIQKRYEAVKDIRAVFEQEARVASIGKTEKSS